MMGWLRQAAGEAALIAAFLLVMGVTHRVKAKLTGRDYVEVLSESVYVAALFCLLAGVVLGVIACVYTFTEWGALGLLEDQD